MDVLKKIFEIQEKLDLVKEGLANQEFNDKASYKDKIPANESERIIDEIDNLLEAFKIFF